MKRLIAIFLFMAAFLSACSPATTDAPPEMQPSSEELEMPSAEPSTQVEEKPRLRQPSTSDAIIADHYAAMAFEDIPECWLEKAKEDLRIGYQHTSHGSQLPSGLEYLEEEFGEPYVWGNGEAELTVYDNAISRYGSDASDLGYGGWSKATRAYLDANPGVNAVMWSWCGQVGGHEDDMESYLLSPAERIAEDYDVTFIYMTGHLDGTGPDGGVERANDLIREHVRKTGGVLFDFADIESYDPAGKHYPDETDACGWCSDWCEDRPQDCENLPGCAHSHGLNCAQKGKAFWWLAARMAGWGGDPDDRCP